MPEYEKLISNLEHAEKHCRAAEASLVPIAKVKQVDAYLLGLLQAMRLILADAKKAASAANRSKAVLPKKSNSRII